MTVESQTGSACVLDLFDVADVIADPTSGTPTNAATGEALAWPNGFTARRAGSDVAVLNSEGTIVLTTGRRYRMCPAADSTKPGSGLAARQPGGGWVIGEVKECDGCELGGYGDPRNRPEATESQSAHVTFGDAD